MEVENWDLDDDFAATESSSRVVSSLFGQVGPSSSSRSHRDSAASRLSHRSEAASSMRGEEEHEIQLSDEADQQSAALAIAARKGFTLPKNVPESALTGGTIKRLGGRRAKKLVADDWADDIELPSATTGPLTLKKSTDTRTLSEAFRSLEISSRSTPAHSPKNAMTFAGRMAQQTQGLSPSHLLSKHQDEENEDDVFADFSPRSIKSQPRDISSGITQQKQLLASQPADEDLEADLELPAAGEPLKLVPREDPPTTPSIIQDDFDDWAEGSLGTRGAKHLGTRSARSSSVSALSPSMSSTFTIESEEDGLTGLTLPAGPIDLEARLKTRQSLQSDASPAPQSNTPATRPPGTDDDGFDDLVFSGTNLLDAAKLARHKNVTIQNCASESSLRRPAVSLTFTSSKVSRLPRPIGGHISGSRLQPVHEDDVAPSYVRPDSRASQASVPSTPSRSRVVPSLGFGRSNAPPPQPYGRASVTTPSAQLLKAKRSMPSMVVTQPTPQKQPLAGRPASRTGDSRPKTPSSRLSADMSHVSGRQPLMPFLPPGSSAQPRTQRSNLRNYRNTRRNDSESSITSDASERAASRAQRVRSPSPRRKNATFAPEALLRQATNKNVLRPARARKYGDGNELDAFDDLPTNSAAERKFEKKPIGSRTIIPKGSKTNLASAAQSRAETPSSSRPSSTVPPSPARSGQTPSFARETASSRAARESRDRPQPLTSVNANARARIPAGAIPHSGPLSSTAMTPSLLSPTPSSLAKTTRTTRKPRSQQKPSLIRCLGDQAKNVRVVNGMTYDPVLCVWKGNDTATSEFDTALTTPVTATPPTSSAKPLKGHLHAFSPPHHHQPVTQRPALISGMGLSSSVPQVVNGMVFDPKRQTWLKQAPADRAASPHKSGYTHSPSSALGGRMSKPRANSTVSSIATIDDDDADPFEGFEELDDTLISTRSAHQGSSGTAGGGPGGRKTANSIGVVIASEDIARGTAKPDIGDEIGGFLVGEEFDVGPRFIQKIEEEEAVWRMVKMPDRPAEAEIEELRGKVKGYLPRASESVRELLKVLEGARNPMGGLVMGGAGFVSSGAGSLKKYKEEEVEDWGDL